MKKKRMLFLAALLFFLSVFSPAAAASAFRPADEEDAFRQSLSLFCQCAFHPEYGSPASGGRLNRWEREITIWAGGSPTREDLTALDDFLSELEEKVPSLPPLRRVREDSRAVLRIWFIPRYLMQAYLEGYTGENWGFFRYETASFAIVSARVGIASDVTDQEERVHLLKEELVGALGLPGDHTVYPDSILYDKWTTVPSLSDVDWRMLNLLYDPALRPGVTEAQARETLESLHAAAP